MDIIPSEPKFEEYMDGLKNRLNECLYKTDNSIPIPISELIPTMCEAMFVHGHLEPIQNYKHILSTLVISTMKAISETDNPKYIGTKQSHNRIIKQVAEYKLPTTMQCMQIYAHAMRIGDKRISASEFMSVTAPIVWTSNFNLSIRLKQMPILAVKQLNNFILSCSFNHPKKDMELSMAFKRDEFKFKDVLKRMGMACNACFKTPLPMLERKHHRMALSTFTAFSAIMYCVILQYYTEASLIKKIATNYIDEAFSRCSILLEKE